MTRQGHLFSLLEGFPRIIVVLVLLLCIFYFNESSCSPIAPKT
jgi:hypothetical protein